MGRDFSDLRMIYHGIRRQDVSIIAFYMMLKEDDGL